MDHEKIRKDFGMDGSKIWFGSPSLSYPPEEIYKKVVSKAQSMFFQFEDGYNKLMKEIEREWKTTAAEFINAEKGEVTGVTCTSDGLNWAAYGVDLKKGDNIVTNDLEFVTAAYPMFYLAKKRGCEIRVAKREGWAMPLENILAETDEKTRFVAVSHVEFCNGYRFNLKELADELHKRNILLIVDAIQSMGVNDINAAEMGFDFLSSGSPKWLCSLHGFGLFYANKKHIKQMEIPYTSFRIIADSREVEEDYTYSKDFVKFYQYDENKIGKLSTSTENTFGKILLTEMMKYFKNIGLKNIENYTQSLARFFSEKLMDRGYKLMSSTDPEHISSIVSFIPKKDGEKLVNELRENNICMTLRAGGIRAGFHIYNNKDEINTIMKYL